MARIIIIIKRNTHKKLKIRNNSLNQNETILTKNNMTKRFSLTNKDHNSGHMSEFNKIK